MRARFGRRLRRGYATIMARGTYRLPTALAVQQTFDRDTDTKETSNPGFLLDEHQETGIAFDGSSGLFDEARSRLPGSGAAGPAGSRFERVR